MIIMTRAKTRYGGKQRRDDGTVCVMLIASPEDAERLTADLADDAIVDINLHEYREEPETAVQWIHEATLKISQKIGVEVDVIRRNLLVQYGADRLRGGKKEYLLSPGGPWMTNSPPCGRAIAANKTALKPPYKLYALRKTFKEYKGTELRKLLEGLNQMLEEMGIPETERASDRLIEFYIEKAGNDEKT